MLKSGKKWLKALIFITVAGLIIFALPPQVSSQTDVEYNIYPTIITREKIHIRVRISDYRPTSAWSPLLALPHFPDLPRFRLENLRIGLIYSYPSYDKDITLTILDKFLCENRDESDNVPLDVFTIILENAQDMANMVFDLEFDIINLDAREELFPFDVYNLEIPMIFPIPEGIEFPIPEYDVSGYLAKPTIEDKTLRLTSHSKLTLKNPDEMSVEGKIYSKIRDRTLGIGQIENWKWGKLNFTYETIGNYQIFFLAPFSAFLFLLVIMGFSWVFLEDPKDRVHFISSTGIGAILTLFTLLIFFNQLAPQGVATIGHFYIALGFMAFAMHSAYCLFLVKFKILPALFVFGWSAGVLLFPLYLFNAMHLFLTHFLFIIFVIYLFPILSITYYHQEIVSFLKRSFRRIRRRRRKLGGRKRQ